VWSLTGPRGKDWLHGLVAIPTSGQYQIIIEGIRGRQFRSDIALDDIGLLPGEACDLTPVDADPFQVALRAISCDFEKDFCQWDFDPTSDFKWTRHTESTSSLDTGPETGRT
jgi:hypothetical protein